MDVFSPYPWFVRGSGSGRAVCDANGRLVALVLAGRKLQPVAQNAGLIMAAPVLFSQIKVALLHLGCDDVAAATRVLTSVRLMAAAAITGKPLTLSKTA